MKVILMIILIFSSLVIFAGDPLDEYDGTESWYEGSMEGNGDIVYYNASYEKDMKKYLAYVKSKQQNENKIKDLSSRVNRRNKPKKKYEEKDDEIGEIGTFKDDEKLSDDLGDDDDNADAPIQKNKKIDTKNASDDSPEDEDELDLD